MIGEKKGDKLKNLFNRITSLITDADEDDKLLISLGIVFLCGLLFILLILLSMVF